MRHVARMRNAIQPYAWGSTTSFEELLGIPNPDRKPQAEIWMGAHPKAPSSVETDAGWEPLDRLIERQPEDILGRRSAAAFGPGLPFLFKVLAAAEPLSIPGPPGCSAGGRGLRARKPSGFPPDASERNYRDPHHKPECLCALTPFWAMCGFRKPRRASSCCGGSARQRSSAKSMRSAQPRTRAGCVGCSPGSCAWTCGGGVRSWPKLCAGGRCGRRAPAMGRPDRPLLPGRHRGPGPGADECRAAGAWAGAVPARRRAALVPAGHGGRDHGQLGQRGARRAHLQARRRPRTAAGAELRTHGPRTGVHSVGESLRNALPDPGRRVQPFRAAPEPRRSIHSADRRGVEVLLCVDGSAQLAEAGAAGRSLGMARGASVLVPASAPATASPGRPCSTRPGCRETTGEPLPDRLPRLRQAEVGRQLAAMLQREWVDMDAVLAGRLGSSIADHVARSGWPSFRLADNLLLRELCGRDGLVVSTGGGVAADRRNAAEMRRSGLVVWLRADPTTLAAQVAADAGASGQRPALRSGADPLDEIRTVLESRTPAYAQAADLSIDTDQLWVDRDLRPGRRMAGHRQRWPRPWPPPRVLP